MANTVIFGAQMQKRRTGRVAKGFAEVGIHQHCVSDGLGRVAKYMNRKMLEKANDKAKTQTTLYIENISAQQLVTYSTPILFGV